MNKQRTDRNRCFSTSEKDFYYPLISTPFGRIPLLGATMTDEREREIARKYPVRYEEKAV